MNTKQLQQLYKTDKQLVKRLFDLYATRDFLRTNRRGEISQINLEKVDRLIFKLELWEQY